ncbi:hypothetical protein OK074_8842 [Actinobacteria bacterium OK074]|nr:hypothetical protein OK074_8842 [Actinobacteria bacterium OK074]
MTTHMRALLAGLLLACGALVATVGVARNTGGGNDDPTPPKGPYVALGDSYTAAPKVPDQDNSPAGCDRSSNNYPSVVARQLGLSGDDFTDVSCSGATTEDLTAAQSTDDGTNPAQLKALSDDTRFVTLGIGGNDIGFSALVKSCVKAGAFYYATGSGKFFGTGDAPCEKEYVDGGTDEVEQRIDKAGGQLADVLAEIKDRAPKARVYVVGYPEILPADGKNCGAEMAMAPGDVKYLSEKEQHLNDELRARAKAAGAGFVDTYSPSEHHNACSDPDTRWVEPLVPASPAAAVHPNERGEKGMAAAVLKAVGA